MNLMKMVYRLTPARFTITNGQTEDEDEDEEMDDEDMLFDGYPCRLLIFLIVWNLLTIFSGRSSWVRWWME